MVETETSDWQWRQEMAAFCWMYIEVEPIELPDGLDMEFKWKEK